jgi:hypothetical protein
MTGHCADHDPDWWFADEGTSEDHAARAICASCPLAATCYNTAVQRDEQWGRWGGVRFPLPTLELADGPTLEPWHGQPAGYKAHGCRCTPCKEAHSRDVAEWRLNRMTGAVRMSATSANKLESCSQIALFDLV